MKHFVPILRNLFLSSAILFALHSRLVCQTMPTLRLNLQGPFTVCEESSGGASVLRVLAPNVTDHYNPRFMTDGPDIELANLGDYEMKMTHATPGHVDTSETSFGQIDHPLHTVACDDNDPRKYLVKLTVPMPDKLMPFAPVKVAFSDDNPARCNNSPPSSNEVIKTYGTSMALIYNSVDLSTVSVCDPTGNCGFYKPAISGGTGTGVLTYFMEQSAPDSVSDPHAHAKASYVAMAALAHASLHCVHFSDMADDNLDGIILDIVGTLDSKQAEKMKANESSGEGVEKSSQAKREEIDKLLRRKMFYNGHTDCHAPIPLQCSQSGSRICSGS